MQTIDQILPNRAADDTANLHVRRHVLPLLTNFSFINIATSITTPTLGRFGRLRIHRQILQDTGEVVGRMRLSFLHPAAKSPLPPYLQCSTKHEKIDKLSLSVLKRYSGCHCTAQTKRLPTNCAASMRPSGDTAIGIKPLPRSLTA